MESIYPWQLQQWNYIQRLLENNELPHAMLLAGQTGLGKTSFAINLCASIFCAQRSQDGMPCGMCKYCQLFSANTYPDFTRIAPEEVDVAVTVDDIRILIERLSLTRHYDSYKIALIESAHQMNSNAANALLKTLEEPPEHTLIILVSDQPQTLPATIRSRCQSVQINPPEQQQGMAWLQKHDDSVDWNPLLAVAQGSPLLALQLQETDLLEQRNAVILGFLELAEDSADPMSISPRFDSISVAQGIRWLQGLVLDLMRLKSDEDPVTLENPDFYRSLLALAPRLEVPLLLELWDWLLDRRKIFDNSLNRRLFVEELLLRSRQMLEKS